MRAIVIFVCLSLAAACGRHGFSPVPAEVRALRAEARSPRSIYVEYAPGFADDPARIALRPGTPPEDCAQGVLVTATSTVIAGLLPRTTYGLRVCGELADGPGVPGTRGLTAQVTTPAERGGPTDPPAPPASPAPAPPIPPAPEAPPDPVAVEVRSISANGFTLSYRSGGGRTRAFRIALDEGAIPSGDGATDDGAVNRDTAELEISFTDLSPDTQYGLRLRAIDDGVPPRHSGGVTRWVRTLPIGGPADPTGLRAVRIAPTQVQLIWDATPDRNTNVRIVYRSGPVPPADCTGNSWIETNASGTTILGLDPALIYSFRVCTISAGPPRVFSPGATVTASAQANQTLATVEPLYANASNWNDYVLNDGPDLFHASGTPCPGTPDPRGCLHGGVLRRVVLSELSSCAGVNARDTRDALRWVCRVEGGQAQVYSTGLAPERRLFDLLDSLAFAPLSIVIDTPRGTFASSPQTWWSNPVRTLPLSSTRLTAAGTIYVGAEGVGRGHVIQNDRIAVVIARGALRTSSTDAILTANGRHSLWLEGAFAGGGTAGIEVDGGSYGQYRHLTVRGSGGAGLQLAGGFENRVDHVVLRGHSGDGLLLSGETNARVSDLYTRDNSNGLRAVGNTALRLFRIVALSNLHEGVELEANADQTAQLQLITASENGEHGLELIGGQFELLSVLSANNGQSGVRLSGGENRLVNIATLANASGLTEAPNNRTHLAGTLITGQNSSRACSGVSSLETPSCSRTGAEGSREYPVATSNALYRPDRSASPLLRSDGYQLSSRGEAVYSQSGDGQRPNETFVEGAPCPSAVSGEDLLRSDSGATEQRSLRNAVEALDDVFGDDDGLCESGERCLYAPHIGADQRLGAAGGLRCAFVDGTIAGVELETARGLIFPSEGMD